MSFETPARHLETADEIRSVVLGMRRVAVLGIKTEAQRDQPGYYVPEYLAGAGVEIVPVPVYYPDAALILGRPVVRTVAAASEVGPIDVVAVFRRPSDLAAHLTDLIAARPRVVWFQSGITNDSVAAELVRNGISVVQDRCLMVEHRRCVPSP